MEHTATAAGLVLLPTAGLASGAGYVFNSQLGANSPIYRISFSSVAVPEPATWAMFILGFGVIGSQLRRRRPRVALRPRQPGRRGDRASDPPRRDRRDG